MWRREELARSGELQAETKIQKCATMTHSYKVRRATAKFNSLRVGGAVISIFTGLYFAVLKYKIIIIIIFISTRRITRLSPLHTHLT